MHFSSDVNVGRAHVCWQTVASLGQLVRSDNSYRNVDYSDSLLTIRFLLHPWAEKFKFLSCLIDAMANVIQTQITGTVAGLEATINTKN